MSFEDCQFVFTDREKDILACIVSGRTSKKSIAATLNISPKTVAFHNQNILQKIHCSSWEYIPQWLDDQKMTESLRSRFANISDEMEQIEVSTLKNKWILFLKKWKKLCLIIIFLIIGTYFISVIFFKKENEFIQENLIKYRIDRKDLLKKITHKMNQFEVHNIPIVCIIGMGGIGKTTLANFWTEEFVQKHPQTFVGTIHAETSISRQLSLEELSTLLAKTPQQKNDLSAIEHTQCQKEKRRLQFIKDALLREKEWILIFDNVESYTDIHELLPKDSNHWGNGHILITTRNAHFSKIDDFSPDNILFIEELTLDESMELFIKLRYKGEGNIPSEEKEQIKAFLKDIPPFPLDISVAARHMKHNNLSFDDYKKQMNLKREEFNVVEQEILTETTTYNQTRYGILSLSFNQVIDKNPKFAFLLKILTLLDSQNIPLHILNQIEDPILCQSFLSEMRKQSLIMDENKKNDFSFLSIHRSTQNFAQTYVKQKFSTEYNQKMLAEFSDIFARYLNDLLDCENFQQIQMIVPHCLRMIENNQIMPSIKGVIAISLGWTYFCLGDDVKAQHYLEYGIELIQQENKNQKTQRKDKVSLNHTNNQKYSEDIHIVRATMYLGIIALRNGQLEKAHKLLTWCLPIYQLSNNFVDYTHNLIFLGHLYMLKDDYEKAKNFLKNSIEIGKKYNVRKTNMGRAHAFLGLLYKEEGDYEKAILEFNKSIEYYDSKMLKAWAMAHKAGCETEMGNYDQSKKILEDCINLYHQNNASHHVILGWVFSFLGSVYRKTREFHKSKKCFEDGLHIYENAQSDDKMLSNIGLSFPLIHLGKLALKIGDLESAEQYLIAGQKENIKIFGEKNSRTMWANFALARLYGRKNQHEKALMVANDCLTYYEKILKPTHPKIAKIKSFIGSLFIKMDKLSDAEHILIEAYHILKKHYKALHCELLPTIDRLIRLYTYLNNVEKMKDFMREKETLLKMMS
ncbi:MAG: hypothetical protein HEEMFOPI_01459 [Holosporales bacterium]